MAKSKTTTDQTPKRKRGGSPAKGKRKPRKVPKKRGTKGRRDEGTKDSVFRDGDQVGLIFLDGEWHGHYTRGAEHVPINVPAGWGYGRFHCACTDAAKVLK